MKQDDTLSNEAAAIDGSILLVNEARIKPGDVKSSGTWVQISPYGDFPHAQGLQRFHEDDAKKIVASFNKLGNVGHRIMGLPWYIGHPDHPRFADQFPDKQAYGRIKVLEARANGLYGLVKFNSKGRQLINEEAYHGHSVNWGVERRMGAFHPMTLKSVGFTNEPNIPVEPILCANQQSTAEPFETSVTLEHYANSFGPWENWDACIAHMTSKKGGYDEESAKKVCGKLQSELGERANVRVKTYTRKDPRTGKTIEVGEHDDSRAAAKGDKESKPEDSKEKQEEPNETGASREEAFNKATGKMESKLDVAKFAVKQMEKVKTTDVASNDIQTDIARLKRVRQQLHTEFADKGKDIKPGLKEDYLKTDKALKDKLDELGRHKAQGGPDISAKEKAKAALQDRIDKGKEAGLKRAAEQPSESDKVSMVKDFASMLQDAGEIITPKMVAEQIKYEHGVDVDPKDVQEILAHLGANKKDQRANQKTNNKGDTTVKLNDLAQRLKLANPEGATEETINAEIDRLLANQADAEGSILLHVRGLMGNEAASNGESIEFINAVVESEEGEAGTKLTVCNAKVAELGNTITQLTTDKTNLTNEKGEVEKKLEAQTTLANSSQEALKSIRAAHRDVMIDAAITGGRITLAQRDEFANKIDADFEKGLVELANQKAGSTGLKTESKIGDIGSKHVNLANEADRRNHALELVNQKMQSDGIGFDRAWEKVEKENPELFKKRDA